MGVATAGYPAGVRLGLLDIGSNSAQLQIVEAAVGAPPLPVHAIRVPTQLADEILPDGSLSVAGADRAAGAVATAIEAAYHYEATRPRPRNSNGCAETCGTHSATRPTS